MTDWQEGLLARAERAFGGSKKVQDAFAGVRAIIGPSTFPDGEELAQQAMEALRHGVVPTPIQRAALETVIKALRPSLLSRKAELDKLPPYNKYSPETVDAWNTFRKTAKPFLYSIGRIDRVNKPSDEPLATGFLVKPNLLVTNKHVLAAISAGTMELQEGQAVVRFGQEYDTSPDTFPPVAILGVEAVHPDLDIALLVIGKTDQLPLTVEAVIPMPGRSVVAVGYPQEDARNPVFTEVIFEGRYKVKRAAPGELTAIGASAVYHDCSTLGGNSGSPLLAMDTIGVVGLHRDGPLFLYRNEAVDAPSLEQFLHPYL